MMELRNCNNIADIYNSNKIIDKTIQITSNHQYNRLLHQYNIMTKNLYLTNIIIKMKYIIFF